MKLDDDFLNGLGGEFLSRQAKDELLRKASRALELRLAERLTENLSDEQLAEFDRIDAGDERARLEWLRQARPDYDQVVAAEAADLRAKLAGQLQAVIDRTATS